LNALITGLMARSISGSFMASFLHVGLKSISHVSSIVILNEERV